MLDQNAGNSRSPAHVHVCTIPWEAPAIACDAPDEDTNSPAALADVLAEGMDRAPRPDIYAQILTTAQEAANTANGVRADAEAGVFDGKPGPKGEPGETVIPTFSIDPGTGNLMANIP